MLGQLKQGYKQNHEENVVAKKYLINCDKPRDASSVTWMSKDHAIEDLEPYIYAIQCDDGENDHELINFEWPRADGKNDFKLIELNNFEAVGDGNNDSYLLCFNAIVEVDLDNLLTFAEALEKSANRVVARIGFKKHGKPIITDLYEMYDDKYVELEEVYRAQSLWLKADGLRKGIENN